MTIDLRTGEQYTPRPEDYCTKIAPVAPGGDCPLWISFLARVTDNDVDLQHYLARVVGYWLTGHTHEHALFFLHGTGANGKSVFIDTIAGMMGDYATTAPIETFLSARGERHPTELTDAARAAHPEFVEYWATRAADASCTTGESEEEITAMLIEKKRTGGPPALSLACAERMQEILMARKNAQQRKTQFNEELPNG